MGSVVGDLLHAVADRMAAAARAWLDSLDRRQRAVAVGVVPADDASGTPSGGAGSTPPRTTVGSPCTPSVPHSSGRDRSSRRVSTAGYVTVATTMGLENVLDHEGSFTLFDRERGRDPGLYYLRVFGEPGGAAPWGWRFGGHHVSLNNLVVDGTLVARTPCFLGADPAVSPLLGGGVHRPLARVEDLARELVRSLSPELAARAVLLDRAPSDCVTANRTCSVVEGDRVVPLAGISTTNASPTMSSRPSSRR